MRRLKHSLDEEDSSEMEVDGEEKMENLEEITEEDEDKAEISNNETPFLDSFYGLSSEDPRERSRAAHTMLQHCLLGQEANTKDASYALRRILNGLCSGRAAARQGNASALASFLKLAFRLNKMDSIQLDTMGEIPPTGNPLSFVREKLLAATDPNQISGKKKGSEERDYQFGRLFGILGIVRSNILVPDETNSCDISDIVDVSSALVADLAELFWLKKWMREPAAHGITTLLKMFFEGSSDEKCSKVLDHLISEVIIPKILNHEKVEFNHRALLESYCAEQIGIACYIQSQTLSLPSKSLYPLNKAILTIESMPLISKAFAETSSVTQPRTHFVWDSIWCYLFEKDDSPENKGEKVQWSVRGRAIIGEDSPIDVTDALVKEVILKKLLGVDSEKASNTLNATHERRSLALCIFKNLSGVPFQSSISGPTRLCLDVDSLENLLLTPVIIRRLFLDVICAGKQNKQSSHLLKPLALEVLSSLPAAMTDLKSNQESEMSREIACVRGLLKSEVRFDARTKTSTIANLLYLTETVREGSADKLFSFWDKYLTFLESQMLEKSSGVSESQAEATGFVELLYSSAKNIARLEAVGESEIAALQRYKDSAIRRILGFFMASAFFDCSEIEPKKGSRKPVVTSSAKLKNVTIPYAIRSIISSRFFSLVSDYVHHETHKKVEVGQSKVVEKDTMTLSFLHEVCKMWESLESSGAKRFSGATVSDDDDTDSSEGVYSLLEGLQQNVKDLTSMLEKDPENLSNEAKRRCCTGIAVLAYTLYLHRLSCGKEDNMIENDNPDADEEEDEEEICNALEGLKDVADDFLGDITDEENPLLGLTELCANILSSPLGSGDMGRGSSPKLVREGVKFAWLGGLRLSAILSSEDRTLLDDSVIGTLMEAIGASSEETMEDDIDDEEDDDDSSDDESTDSGDNNIFSQASNLLENVNDMELDEEAEEIVDDDESDVQLDSARLRSMLEEDSDADVDSDVLEHHEGADAALAKLIKLKQESRKAAQLAKEKIEVSNQLRCTFLIELLFGRSDAWNRLFRSEIIFKMLVPMLKHRKRVGQTLDRSTENRSNTGRGEKQALLDKLTSLLKLKICKMKVIAMPIASSSHGTVIASKLVEDILNEARRSTNKDHASCCTNCVLFILRTIESAADRISAATALGGAVEEWSTKRTSRLESSLFDDLIMQMPSLAQVVLLLPMLKACESARSPFLKAEAFRILSQLYATTPNPEHSEIERKATESIKDGSKEVLALIARSLEDEEMKKTKRARALLKALEKIIQNMPSSATGCLSHLESLKTLIGDFDSDSNAVNGACAKIAIDIELKIVEIEAELKSSQKSQLGAGSSTKKSKKKKKKKR